jgi:chlorite dismutase
MTVKPGVDRVEKYSVKYDTEVIKRMTDKRRDRMLAKFTEKQEALVTLETRAKEVLGECGVPTYTYVAYLNFSREVWKKAQRFSGESLLMEVQVILDKWKARKLEERVLNRVRKDCFGLGPPRS